MGKEQDGINNFDSDTTIVTHHSKSGDGIAASSITATPISTYDISQKSSVPLKTSIPPKSAASLIITTTSSSKPSSHLDVPNVLDIAEQWGVNDSSKQGEPASLAVLSYLRKRGLGGAALELQRHLEVERRINKGKKIDEDKQKDKDSKSSSLDSKISESEEVDKKNKVEEQLSSKDDSSKIDHMDIDHHDNDGDEVKNSSRESDMKSCKDQNKDNIEDKNNNKDSSLDITKEDKEKKNEKRTENPINLKSEEDREMEVETELFEMKSRNERTAL